MTLQVKRRQAQNNYRSSKQLLSKVEREATQTTVNVTEFFKIDNNRGNMSVGCPLLSGTSETCRIHEKLVAEKLTDSTISVFPYERRI